SRAYGDRDPAGAASATAALAVSLSTLHRLFAPFLPFTTEEAWSGGMEGSVHRAAWPDAEGLRSLAGDGEPAALEVASAVLSELRGAKSAAKVSMRAAIQSAVVHDTQDRLDLLTSVADDVTDAAKVAQLRTEVADALRVEATVI